MRERAADRARERDHGAPPIALGSAITARRDRFPLTQLETAECGAYPTRAGSIAAYVDIASPGTYRFGLLRATPLGVAFEDKPLVSMEIRSACEDPAAGIACDVGFDIDTFQTGAEIDLDLTPGRYFVVTGSPGRWQSPSDITIGVAPADAWSPEAMLPGPAPLPPMEPLLGGDAASTPAHEPEPATAVDRLIRVEIAAEEVRTVRADLAAACLGTMPRLSATPPHQALVASEAESCVASERAREPVAPMVPADPEAAAAASRVGTFDPSAPCASTPPADRVCVPGGFALLGERPEQSSQGATAPPRAVVVRPFRMDRFEVTVGAFRQALAEGLTLISVDQPRENNGPLEWDTDAISKCTYSAAPLLASASREAYPITCVSWYAARAYCQFRGGDLPTEAQWDFAARWAGRATPSRFAWGDDPPQCACDGSITPCHAPVFGAAYNEGIDVGIDHYACAIVDGAIDLSRVGPRPAEAAIGPHTDATPLGIVNLGGNVSEWTRDAFHPLGSACWTRTGLTDPLCWEDRAPERARHGGNFESGPYATTASLRFATMPARLEETIGFRCAYPEAP